ncbi:RNA polymerase sigma factor [Paenibacillus aquistagni]|uniref:RNA polymerase sigma factor n=1 Tax=Paenibacillus aquistagni TaxID=1852522 RepID=UPI0014823292|nr:RNA polymerase sigma factor [Paenibacillus aquistagni]
MKPEEALLYLEDKAFLDSLFGYAYKRCSSAYEAEDLCSEIIVQLLKSLRRQEDIHHFYGYAWTIAQRVYADFSEKRKRLSSEATLTTNATAPLHAVIHPIDAFINQESNADALRRIQREIAFLSKMYRDVMIMYYLDGMKTAAIAHKLGILETTVKQRLFSARNTIRKEVTNKNMDNSNLTLKPVKLLLIGTGAPSGHDPRVKAERLFSQNLIYLCKNTARTPKELSELLHVPMPFVEEELEIQCRGENGHYGLLKRLDSGKYISNLVLIDAQDLARIQEAYRPYTQEIVDKAVHYLRTHEQRILRFPFLSQPPEASQIAWSLISRMIWAFEDRVKQRLTEKYYAAMELHEKEFHTFGFAVKETEEIELNVYGCDGIQALNLCGYRKVYAANIYGPRLQKHFNCGHQMSLDPVMMLTLLAIKGLKADSLTEDEKEVAAKAIEAGCLRKENDALYPNILVIDAKDEDAFYALSTEFTDSIDDLLEPFADAIHAMIKTYVPRHLIHDYPLFVLQTTCGLINDVIESCMEKGVLSTPASSYGSEGIWMIVEQ